MNNLYPERLLCDVIASAGVPFELRERAAVSLADFFRSKLGRHITVGGYGYQLTHEQYNTIQDFLSKRQKIDAIKELRAIELPLEFQSMYRAKYFGLKDAKDAVENPANFSQLVHEEHPLQHRMVKPLVKEPAIVQWARTPDRRPDVEQKRIDGRFANGETCSCGRSDAHYWQPGCDQGYQVEGGCRCGRTDAHWRDECNKAPEPHTVYVTPPAGCWCACGLAEPHWRKEHCSEIGQWKDIHGDPITVAEITGNGNAALEA